METPLRDSGRDAFIQNSLPLAALGLPKAASGAAAIVGPAAAPSRGLAPAWRAVVELDRARTLVQGDWEALARAVRRGADLRLRTQFYHHEHIEPGSSNHALVEEVMDWRIVHLIENNWVAAAANLRQPISLLGDGFVPAPSLSLFLYNQDGRQALARLHLGGPPREGARGQGPAAQDPRMPKYRLEDEWDAETNAPSRNYVYEFESYRWLVRDDWTELYSHTAEGEARAGSRDALIEAFRQGCELKVAVEGLCDDLLPTGEPPRSHETFVHCGATYCYVEDQLLSAGSQPVVRVRPGIPVVYRSGNWDYGWLYLRTDGKVTRRLIDPYTLRFADSVRHHALRWFAR